MIRISLFLLTLFSSVATIRANTLPSRDPHEVLPQLARIQKGDSLQMIELLLGKPDGSFVSGFYFYTFRLTDSTTVYVATPDGRRVFGVRRSAPGANAETYYEPVPRILMHPAPRSAPF